MQHGLLGSRRPAPAPRRAGIAALIAVLACASACKDRRRHAEPAPGSAATPGPASAPGLALGAAAAHRPAPDRIEGTLTLDGKPLAIERCRPGRDGALYVDMVTAAGALRFVSGETDRLFFRPRPEDGGRGAAIRCAIPHRSWGGGTRADGASYFRGELTFSCEGPPAISGEVSLDCGDIQPDERTSLDEQRRLKREAQGLPAGAAAAPDR